MSSIEEQPTPSVGDKPVVAVPPAGPNPAVKGNPKGRRRAFAIFFLILMCIGAAGSLYWMRTRGFESTDDAQVDAHLNPVSSRVDGNVTHVYVDDNQSVQVGQPLVDLDQRDFQVGVDESSAQLSQAQSMVIAQRPNVPITQTENTTNISAGGADVANATAALGFSERDRESSQAKLREAEANAAKAQADLARYKILIAKEEISQQEFDQIVATAQAQAAAVDANRASVQAAAQTVDQRRAQLDEARTRLAQYQRNAPGQVAIRRATVQSSEASTKNAQAQLEQAHLRLSYTKISAPVAGIVMKRSAEVGSHVAAGQQLLMIAQVGDMWVTANFKETQLRRIRAGQTVTLHVDALKRDFQGYIENIGGSTGAVASVLPPENATGNYVKVVQRIPVRIRFKPNQSGMEELRPGMSVEPDVQIGG